MYRHSAVGSPHVADYYVRKETTAGFSGGSDFSPTTASKVTIAESSPGQSQISILAATNGPIVITNNTMYCIGQYLADLEKTTQVDSEVIEYNIVAKAVLSSEKALILPFVTMTTNTAAADGDVIDGEKVTFLSPDLYQKTGTTTLMSAKGEVAVRSEDITSGTGRIIVGVAYFGFQTSGIDTINQALSQISLRRLNNGPSYPRFQGG